ncbi:hypothetical protein JCM10213_000802 [Rhodosporidiobolus nylandii]
MYLAADGTPRYPSFRDYNATYESWLSRACSPSADSRIAQPSEAYAECLGDFFLALTERIVDLVLTFNRNLQRVWFYEDLDTYFFEPWAECSVAQREQLFLDVLEDMQRRF